MEVIVAATIIITITIIIMVDITITVDIMVDMAVAMEDTTVAMADMVVTELVQPREIPTRFSIIKSIIKS